MRLCLYMAAVIAVLGVSAEASAQNVITNGSFESGLTGWSSTGTNTDGGGCDQRWVVSASAPCQGVPSSTPYGSLFANTSFDGNGPQNFLLSQTFFNPFGAVAGTLSFADAYRWQFGGANRDFFVRFLDASSNLLGTVYNMSVSPGSGFIDWTTHTLDVSALLSANQGQNLTLQFDTFIPANFTGPGGQGLDNVSLDIQATTTPEPATLGLMLTGLVGIIGVARRRRVT